MQIANWVRWATEHCQQVKKRGRYHSHGQRQQRQLTGTPAGLPRLKAAAVHLSTCRHRAVLLPRQHSRGRRGGSQSCQWTRQGGERCWHSACRCRCRVKALGIPYVDYRARQINADANLVSATLANRGEGQAGRNGTNPGKLETRTSPSGIPVLASTTRTWPLRRDSVRTKLTSEERQPTCRCGTPIWLAP